MATKNKRKSGAEVTKIISSEGIKMSSILSTSSSKYET